MSHRPKPLALIILDGYGYSEDDRDNAINQANRPVFDRLWQEYTHTLVSGSGLDVGLPDGQMGNSEVGHLNLGAGRVVYQELTRIGKAISAGETGEFRCRTCKRGPPLTKKYAKGQCQTCYKKNKKIQKEEDYIHAPGYHPGMAMGYP